MSGCTSDSNSWRASERGARSRARLGFALAAAALGSLAVAARGIQQPSAPQRSVMNEVSRRFRELEAHVEAGDLEAIAASADWGEKLRERLVSLEELVSAAKRPGFAREAERLADLADDAARWAARGAPVETRQAFEDLRASCVSCHVRFRGDNEQRGDYPARENTITGSVELRDADGSARDDRSWVLVFLESESTPANSTALRANPRISQRGRQFHPRVLPVPVGSTVEFPNDDTIFHNVFSLSKTAPFDLGVYEAGQTASVKMSRTGLVKVYCNIHPEMAASIVVLANRWYALTDESGAFVIAGVPDGEYALRAWNDMGAESRQPLAVSAGQVVRASISLQETRRSMAHTNKFGKPYSGKYK